jgi:hypothetical protein
MPQPSANQPGRTVLTRPGVHSAPAPRAGRLREPAGKAFSARPHRRDQHFDPFGAKYRVERTSELHIPIANQEPVSAIGRPARQVP